MGAWGHGPLENDNAADWFGALFDATELRERAAEGLASDHPDDLRAAAWLVGQLARVYVWPVDHLDEDRIAAGAGLLRLRQDEDWLEQWDDAEEVTAELDAQLEALELSPAERKQAQRAAGVAPKKAKKTTAKRKQAKKKQAKKKTTAKGKASAVESDGRYICGHAHITPRKAAECFNGPLGPGWVYLELQAGTSSKFWGIRVDGASHTVRYGRIGTAGQEKTKSFSTHEAAAAAAMKLILQKRKKGYDGAR